MYHPDPIDQALASVPRPLVPAPPRAVPTPPWHTLLAGQQSPAGLGTTTVLPDFDFETYSEAGYLWQPAANTWGALPGAPQGKKGLGVVGGAVYAEHPSTEVLSMYYDLKDGRGRRRWLPHMPPPTDLLEHVQRGGLLEAFNSIFEWRIWNMVCASRYSWPPLPLHQLRCAMAKGRAWALPGGLKDVGNVLNLTYKKDPDGDRLLKKFSMPQNPTAKRKSLRILPADEPEEAERLYGYNERDIVTEAEASSRVPDLPQEELQYWLMDQEINARGVQMDVAGIENCITIVEEAHSRYNTELHQLTGGAVARASEVAKLTTWLAERGCYMLTMDGDAVEEALAADDKAQLAAQNLLDHHIIDDDTERTWSMQAQRAMSPDARRALELRAKVGSAAVKKLFAMRLGLTRAGRIHDLFTYHGARTGRTTGNGAQPTNLPNSGPELCRCGACGHYAAPDHATCPWCLVPQPPGRKTHEWGAEQLVDVLAIVAGRSLDLVEHFFGDAMAAISGCLRGLFVAAPGHDLIVSDYSAIEAVVLAMVAGEQWRIDVFRTHGKIYETSAAKISGVPFEEFMRAAGYNDAELAAPDWYTRKPATPTGKHHPLRKKIGKIAELASGYQGWVGSWIAFGADEFMGEQEMKDAILAWRAASPAIVEFWGGQERRIGYNRVPELYGVEGMFIAAMREPGRVFEFRGFKFQMRDDVLYLTLLSGRHMVYHRPRLEPSERGGEAISYEGWNTNPKNGPMGWIRIRTWGGRLVENIVQATARDIQWHGMYKLRAAGYPIVLHVYDENVGEVPLGFGSVEEFERIMATMPAWAADWPIRASGGWRGPRYGK